MIQSDIFILGAGIAGVAAAVRAARLGAQVVLADMNPFAGGMATAGMVSPFMKHEIEGEALVKGVFLELEEEMRAQNGMINHGFYGSAFRNASWILLQKAGVRSLFDSFLIDTEMNGSSISKVLIRSSEGVETIQASFFIDCSGDAQLLHSAGLPTLKGDRLQALTLFFRMGGICLQDVARDVQKRPENFFPWVDSVYLPDRIMSVAGYFSELKKAQQEGAMHPDLEYIFFTSQQRRGEGAFNTSNILGLDGSISRDLTQAEWIGRQQVKQVVDLLCSGTVPGFEKSFLIETAPQVGVRETRRALGDYAVTGDDIRRAAKFRDAVARGNYGVDIHGQKDELSVMEDLPEGAWYEVPYRSLLVRDARNVLAAGRCISATREGHGALRIMPTSSATGEAAGAAAALAHTLNCSLRDVPYSTLHQAVAHNLSPLQ